MTGKSDITKRYEKMFERMKNMPHHSSRLKTLLEITYGKDKSYEEMEKEFHSNPEIVEKILQNIDKLTEGTENEEIFQKELDANPEYVAFMDKIIKQINDKK